MRALIDRFFKHQTNRDVVINTLGNYLNVVFVAFFALILVRIMSPADYGVLSVLLGISYVLANMLDFGTTATIYSYVPDLYLNKNPRLYQFIKSTFFFQSLFSIIVLTVLFIGFPWLDRVFFKTGAPLPVLYLTAISVLFYIWQNFFTNILFAAKKFLKANTYINISNLIKTIIIVVLSYLGYASIGVILFVFGIVGPTIFFTLVALSRRDVVMTFIQANVKREEVRFGYTLQYFVATQFYNLALRMDLFLLSYYGLKDEVGFYGLSQKIILTIITFIVSVTQVLSPAFATLQKREDIIKQIKTACLYMLFPTTIFTLLAITPDFVFKLAFTESFGQTGSITRALALAFILTPLANIPLLILLYTVRKPAYILMTNLLFFLIISLGCYYLIPIYGMFGPVYVIFGAFAVVVILQSILAVREVKRIE